MKKEEFTPGPYHRAYANDVPVIACVGNTIIAEVRNVVGHDTKANMKLFIAAPDMYEALKICWASLQTYGEHPLIKTQIEAALNKANPQI